MEPQVHLPFPGGFVWLRGPFPTEVTWAADKGIQFISRAVMIEWLNYEFPDWRKHITNSEGL